MTDELPWTWNYWVYDEDEGEHRDPRAHENDLEWFHSEEFDADYGKWIRRGSWSADQATALTFGKDPDRVNLNYVENEAYGPSIFAQYYVALLTKIVAAQTSGDLPKWISPPIYLDWAKRNRIRVANGVHDYVERADREFDELRTENQRLVDKVDRLEWREIELNNEVQQLRYELDRVRTMSEPSEVSRPNPSAETNKRQTLLKLVLVMAIGGYRYQVNATRQGIPKEISDDATRYGISISDDTIRKHLSEAAASFGYLVKEQ